MGIATRAGIAIAISVASLLVCTSATAAKTPRWFQPLLSLPRADEAGARCVMWEESRSTFTHPNLDDDNGEPGDSGIFQIDNTPRGIWDTYVMPTLHVQVWNATAYQQAEGFVMIWRIDRFSPWTRYDGCSA